MSTGDLFIGVVIMVIASGIVLLNDKLKSNKSKIPKPSKKRSYGWKTLVSSLILIILLFLVYRMFGDNAQRLLDWLFILFVGIVLITILFINRKSFWLLLKSLCSGKLPRIVHKDANGNMAIKCPSCSSIAQFNADKNSFICKNCGESSKIITEPNIRDKTDC